MPYGHCILSLLGITDRNIKILDVFEEIKGKGQGRRQYQIIRAVLSYKLTLCPNCGFNALRKNGSFVTHVRLHGARDIPSILQLKKQRWFCDNCQTTCSASTPLVKPKHVISNLVNEYVLKLSYERLPVKTIARIVGISETTTQRILNKHLENHPASKLPKHLSFDEFRGTHHQMAFICINAVSHKLVTLLGSRRNNSIIHFFENRYTPLERGAVETITMDMNASYQLIIRRLFPNARIIIDRFHSIQLVGHALDQIRIQALKGLKNKRSREYRALKTQWRVFHKTNPNGTISRFRYGLNEYKTDWETIVLGTAKHPDLKEIHEFYLRFHDALINNPNAENIRRLIQTSHSENPVISQVLRTLRHNLKGIMESANTRLSNGPIEGINRKIKSLTRSCFGFRNQRNLFKRIFQICS